MNRLPALTGIEQLRILIDQSVARLCRKILHYTQLIDADFIIIRTYSHSRMLKRRRLLCKHDVNSTVQEAQL